MYLMTNRLEETAKFLESMFTAIIIIEFFDVLAIKSYGLYLGTFTLLFEVFSIIALAVAKHLDKRDEEKNNV